MCTTSLKDGRFFSDGDVERAANVVVLGTIRRTNCSGLTSPLGQDVTIAGMVFTVVGVMDQTETGVWGRKEPRRQQGVFSRHNIP